MVTAMLYFISLGDRARLESIKLANICRIGGLSCELDYKDRGIKGQFKEADKNNARFTCILGDNELDSFTINIKDNQTDEQETISLYDVYPYIINKLNTQALGACATCKEKKEN